MRERMRERRREREREIYKKRKKERTKERERASSMPNDVVTAGNKAPQVEFLSSVLPILWMCITVFAWFTPSLMDCRVWSQVIAFAGAYGFTVFRAHLWRKTPAILKWSSTILTVTRIYIYSIIDIFYIFLYIILYHSITFSPGWFHPSGHVLSDLLGHCQTCQADALVSRCFY